MTAGMADLGWNTEPELRKRRRWPRNLVIVLLVLAGLFTAADRIAVGIAESTIASRIQTSQNLTSKPSVTIAGFPFLTQLLGRSLDKVSLDARGVVRNGVHVTDLRADLHGVKPTPGYKQATVDQLDGTAFFSFADLEAAAATQRLDVVISDAGNGNVRITGNIDVAGQSVRATVESSLTIGAGNQVSLTAVKVETSIAGLGAVVPRDLNYTIPVGVLPLSMQLKNFQVAPDGVRISAFANGVTITSSGIQ
jgi:hypothetical protein